MSNYLLAGVVGGVYLGRHYEERGVAKYRYDMDKKRIAKRLASGRGSGEGADYHPFLKTRDVPSLGRRSRILGCTTGRVHHFLSDLEARAFYELEWDDDVIDIREQFPLPREVTRRIARDFGVKHPRAPESDTDAVMTTDIVFDVRVGEVFHRHPVFVKYAADLQGRRTVEKLEIERRYWALQGLRLQVWTEERLPTTRGDNLQWLHAMHHLDANPFPQPGHWRNRGNELIGLLRRCPPHVSLADVIKRAESLGGYEPGEVLSLIRYLGWRKVVTIDLDRRFDVRWPVSSLGLTPA